MDLTYPPEAEEFRVEIRQWLEEQPSRRLVRRRLLDDRRRARRLARAVDRHALRGRLDLRHLAHRVRRQGPHHHAGRGARRGVRPGRRPDARRLLRRHPRRAHHPPVGHRGAEEGVHPRHPLGHHRLVPGLLRARRRLRPRQPRDHRRARRRRVGHQRPEDLDHPGLRRRLRLRALPHRQGRPQAQGHLLPARAHAPGGRRGPGHQADRRLGRVRRGLLHQRPLPEGQRRRRPQQRLGRGHDHPRLRARHLGHHRLPPLRDRAEPHHRGGQGQRRHRRPADPPAHRQGLLGQVQIMRINGLRSLAVALTGKKDRASPPSAPPTRSSGASTTRRS